MAISEFCHRNVVCATRDTTVTEAANLMRQHHIGDVIIVETRAGKQVPVGIVTDRDIVVEVIAAGIDPTLLKLGDLRYDVGPGLRYQTPIGPIRFDVGYQLNPIPGLLVNGALQSRRWRMHFSIGQAF